MCSTDVAARHAAVDPLVAHQALTDASRDLSSPQTRPHFCVLRGSNLRLLTIAQADDLRIAEKPNRPTGCGRPSSCSGAAERRLFDAPDGDRAPESEVVLQGGDSIETALTYREHRRDLTVFEPANPDAERCQVAVEGGR